MRKKRTSSGEKTEEEGRRRYMEEEGRRRYGSGGGRTTEPLEEDHGGSEAIAETEEAFRLHHAGLVARSAAGHAARGMVISDGTWVDIQHHTFRNWVNVQLRDTGLQVEDLSQDLCDGVALVALVESLQKRSLRSVKKVTNQHQALENVTTALTAIERDGIRLVNIGNTDIVNGNLKLVLGLVWSLIDHYQIGASTCPPKKFMASWLKAALPDCEIRNFTTDWNSGRNLSALVDYCRPGLCPDWRELDPRNSTENCRVAMELARKEFSIPMVLSPEYLANPHLDDLSGMTYLSYFLKDGGPGYRATLDWVQETIPECDVKNFTTDWNDGRALSALVRKLGGAVPGYQNLDTRPDRWEANLGAAQEAGRKLGVEAVLPPVDMARRDVTYLGPMAYLAHYRGLPQRAPPSAALQVVCKDKSVRVHSQVDFRVEYVAEEVERSEISVQVHSPTGQVPVEVDSDHRQLRASFTPTNVGFHEIEVQYQGEQVDGCPVRVRVLPEATRPMGEGGLEPCALGSVVEVLIKSNGVGPEGDMVVVARGPGGRDLPCPLSEEGGVWTAAFTPDGAGQWSIGVTYEGRHIQGSPFPCHVYDPNAIQILNLSDGPSAPAGRPFTLLLDAAACGLGEVKTDVTLRGKSEPSKTLEVDASLYEMTFTPFEAARYKVYVYFHGHEVKGSPFSLYLGVEQPLERKHKSKARKVKKSAGEVKDAGDIIKEYSTSSGGDSLVKTFDNTFDSSNSKYNSNSKLNGANNSRDYGNSSSNYMSSFSQNNNNNNDSSYHGSLNRAKNKSNLENSSLFNSSTLKSTKTTYETSSNRKNFSRQEEEKGPHVPRIIAFDFGPESKTKFDVAKNHGSPTSSPVRSLAHTPAHSPAYSNPVSKTLFGNRLSSSNHVSSDVVDSHTSSFNSSVVKTSTEHRGSSTPFRKESSPADITNWSQLSPPPSPIRRGTSPATEDGGPLSAPQRVAGVNRAGPRATEGKSFFYSNVANMNILPSTY